MGMTTITTISKRTTADLMKGGRLLLKDLLRRPVADDSVLDQLRGAAEAALAAAQQDKQTALARFDELGSDEALDAVEAAEAAERAALQHMARAERLLKQRDDQHDFEHRAALVRRRAELTSKQLADAVESKQRELAREEADALIRAINARNTLWEMEYESLARHRELAAITAELDGGEPNLSVQDVAPAVRPTINLLHTWVSELPDTDRRRKMVVDLIAVIAPGFFRGPTN